MSLLPAFALVRREGRMLLLSRAGLLLSLVQSPSALGQAFFSFSKSLLCHSYKHSSVIVRVSFDAWKSLLGVLRKAFLFS